MAKTQVETSNALRVQAFEKELYEDTMKESYFMPRFAGEGRGNIMQIKTIMEGGQGDNGFPIGHSTQVALLRFG